MPWWLVSWWFVFQCTRINRKPVNPLQSAPSFSKYQTGVPVCPLIHTDTRPVWLRASLLQQPCRISMETSTHAPSHCYKFMICLTDFFRVIHVIKFSYKPISKSYFHWIHTLYTREIHIYRSRWKTFGNVYEMWLMYSNHWSRRSSRILMTGLPVYSSKQIFSESSSVSSVVLFMPIRCACMLWINTDTRPVWLLYALNSQTPDLFDWELVFCRNLV